MKRSYEILAASLLMILVTLLAGCGQQSVSARGNSRDAGFVEGAFPPTLSNKEYHTKSWTRTDCLTCHETGVQEAPKLKHVSVPELAAEVKCRTCHVAEAATNATP